MGQLVQVVLGQDLCEMTKYLFDDLKLLMCGLMNRNCMPSLVRNALCIQGPGPCNGWLMFKYTNHGKCLISHKGGGWHLGKMRKPVCCVPKPGQAL